MNLSNLSFRSACFASTLVFIAFISTGCGGGGGGGATPVTTMPPTIASGPVDRTAIAGDTVTFVVTASGTPAPSFQWERSADGTSWTSVAGGTSANLSFTALAADNGAHFRVHAQNTAGAVISPSAILTVQYKPSFMLQPQNQTIAAGSLVTFSVQASGNPSPTYQWEKSIDGNTWLSIADATQPIYTFTAQLRDNGSYYRVNAINSTGFIYSNSASLVVSNSIGPGTFSKTLAMNEPRMWHTATLLKNGKILIVGGHSHEYGTTNSAEIYDPSIGKFQYTGHLKYERCRHSATLLNDGRVLIIGGESSLGVLSSVEIYDPSTETFTLSGNMIDPRESHTATLLPDGNVLVIGGLSWGGCLQNAELYNTASGTFDRISSLMSEWRQNHTATLLPNGEILIVGGGNKGKVDLYNVNTKTFSQTGKMAVYERDRHIAVLLNNDKVLVAGGSCFSDYNTVELYDYNTGSFSSTGSMSQAKFNFGAASLANGKVLIVGGSVGTYGGDATAEIYDPASGTFTNTASMHDRRENHTVTILSDGSVLVTGGDTNATFAIATAETYR